MSEPLAGPGRDPDRCRDTEPAAEGLPSQRLESARSRAQARAGSNPVSRRIPVKTPEEQRQAGAGTDRNPGRTANRVGNGRDRVRTVGYFIAASWIRLPQVSSRTAVTTGP